MIVVDLGWEQQQAWQARALEEQRFCKRQHEQMGLEGRRVIANLKKVEFQSRASAASS